MLNVFCSRATPKKNLTKSALKFVLLHDRHFESTPDGCCSNLWVRFWCLKWKFYWESRSLSDLKFSDWAVAWDAASTGRSRIYRRRRRSSRSWQKRRAEIEPAWKSAIHERFDGRIRFGNVDSRHTGSRCQGAHIVLEIIRDNFGCLDYWKF